MLHSQDELLSLFWRKEAPSFALLSVRPSFHVSNNKYTCYIFTVRTATNTPAFASPLSLSLDSASRYLFMSNAVLSSLLLSFDSGLHSVWFIMNTTKSFSDIHLQTNCKSYNFDTDPYLLSIMSHTECTLLGCYVICGARCI